MSSSRKRAPSPSSSAPGKPPKQAKPVHSFFTPASQKAKASSGQSFWVKDAPSSVLHYSHLAHLVDRTPVPGGSVAPIDASPIASGSSSTPTAPSPPPASSSAAASPTNSTTTPGPARTKVAFFDLDGTLIRTKSGAKFPKGADDWVFWSAGVCARVRKLHEDGWRIAIISNQNGLPVAKSGTQVRRDQWKAKVEQIALKFPSTPIEVLAALDKDHFRKPLLGLWDLYSARVLAGGGKSGGAGSSSAAAVADSGPLDLEQSFYVGDAAGRKSDHGDGDRKWAANAGVRFFTPEMFFDGKPDDLPPLVGFQPSQLADEPFFTPTNTPLFPSPSAATPELLVLVGPPGAGKSLFTREHLTPRGYVRVNQDELGSRSKCVTRAREALEVREGEGPRSSVVVDNTNRDRATRAVWIALAKELGVGVRIFVFNPTPTLLALAKHNNLFRLYPSTPGAHVPPIATASFVKSFEAVDGALELGEGGEGRVKRVWMGGWRGGDEDERKRWEGWMS